MATTEPSTIERVGDDSDPPAVLPSADPTPTVAAVSIKLPPFWPADPEVWFAQVEAQFTTRGVTTQKTRFDYVVSNLSSDFATEVRDLLLRPPTENPYDKLKAELIKRTAASEQRKLQQLISGEELGDRKPTQLLRRMQQLLGDHGTEANLTFLRELFLQRLPPNVRMVLASTGDTMDLATLADMADKVIEVAAPSVSAISQPPPGFDSDLTQLRADVSRLTDLVASLTRERPPRRRRSISRGHSPAPTGSQPPQTTLCWYHKKFGEAAKKCQEPCNWGNA